MIRALQDETVQSAHGQCCDKRSRTMYSFVYLRPPPTVCSNWLVTCLSRHRHEFCIRLVTLPHDELLPFREKGNIVYCHLHQLQLLSEEYWSLDAESSRLSSGMLIETDF